MHVTPHPNGDDVLLEIPPGGRHEYGFRIPGNQAPGTHWYHPHKHGSVAIQVLNGMAGAFIVEGGGLDSLAAEHRMREHLVALQQIDTQPNIIRDDPNASQPATLVNGKFRPVILMAPNEVQRWRIVNENITKTATFAIFVGDTVVTQGEPVLFDVARDGVQYASSNYAPAGEPQPDRSVVVSPGNRLDVFVKAPTVPGLYAVNAAFLAHADTADQTRKVDLDPGPGVQVPTGARRPGPRQGQRVTQASAGVAAAPTADVPMLYVQVDPSLTPNGSSLPKALPPLPWFLGNLQGTLNPDSVPVIVFADSGFGTRSPTNPTRFFLGSQQNPWMKFNPDSVFVPSTASNVSMPMVLRDTQTWKVVNESRAANHPFHIHINPFQVIDVEYGSGDKLAGLYAQLDSAAARGTPIWLDVVPLPKPFTDPTGKTVPGHVVIRQEYATFRNADGTPCTNCGDPTGWFVMHCHILGHEERGMMQLLEIIAPGGKVGPVPANWITGNGSHHASPGHRH
jgi:FtsP/CotA-like multicopper oxidase with cupredoxin domain